MSGMSRSQVRRLLDERDDPQAATISVLRVALDTLRKNADIGGMNR